MNNKKEVIEYIYENKNGLKSDFLKKFKEEDFEFAYLSNLIKRCVRETNEASWKITNEGYDFYFILHPEKQYKEFSFFDKLVDVMNYLLYFKKEIKENNKRDKIKTEYFKNSGEK